MKNKEKAKIEVLIFETCIAIIKNSVGTKMFQNLFARVNGKKKDIVEGGNLSCAYFVSSILFLFKFLKEGVHATVGGTVRDMQNSGWQKIQKPKIGCVVVWEKKDFGKGETHKHIGFFIGNNKAISNSTKLGYLIIHPLKSKDRKIESLFWYPKFEK